MDRASAPPNPRWSSQAAALVGAAHPGPAIAVTILAGLLASAFQLSGSRVSLLIAAVLAGQLSIGWANDLLDVARDRIAGRTDKPLAAGAVSERTVRTACALALAAAIVLSVACGPRAAAAHLSGVAAGWLYNLGLKATVWSWLPYAVAFAGLPIFVSLTGSASSIPPGWIVLAGSLLGVGAHLLNALPDLDDDALTGVRGLPHRIGERWTRRVAALVLTLASVIIVFGAPIASVPVAGISLAMVGMLAIVAVIGSGAVPFWAAVSIALLDVGLLIWAR